MSMPAEYFDVLYTSSDDPWQFRRRWYESRKREITLSALPRQRYRSGFEVGCSNGELSADLANRCQRLLCCDTSPKAVALAQERLAQHQHAQVYTGQLPAAWPEQTFDLIVLSEVAYYLDEADLIQLIERCVSSLTDDGVLLACHWLQPIADSPLDGHQVHRLLQERVPFRRVVRHEEDNFLLEVWSVSPVSVDLNEAVL